MTIRIRTTHDVAAWMELVRIVKDNFPGLESEAALREHENTVLHFMQRQEALCAKENERITGVLLFSKADGELCFLAVHPNERRQHVGEKLVRAMLSMLPPHGCVKVLTYCDNVPEGEAARKLYRKIGFEPVRNTEAFGQPVQEMELKY